MSWSSLSRRRQPTGKLQSSNLSSCLRGRLGLNTVYYPTSVPLFPPNAYGNSSWVFFLLDDRLASYLSTAKRKVIKSEQSTTSQEFTDGIIRMMLGIYFYTYTHLKVLFVRILVENIYK